MAKTSTIEIKLMGQRIVLKSSETDPEVIRQVLSLVSTKISEVEERNGGSAPHQIALLALLDLAEEYVKAKRRTLDFKQQLDNKSSQLLNLVEANFE